MKRAERAERAAVVMWRVFALSVCVALALGGCASFKAAFQNMTPPQKAKYAINLAYVAADEGLKLARLFMENEEDLDKLEAKLAEVFTQISSSVNVILALIPPGMDGVGEYAQEKIDALNSSMEELETDFSS